MLIQSRFGGVGHDNVVVVDWGIGLGSVSVLMFVLCLLMILIVEEGNKMLGLALVEQNDAS